MTKREISNSIRRIEDDLLTAMVLVNELTSNEFLNRIEFVQKRLKRLAKEIDEDDYIKRID